MLSCTTPCSFLQSLEVIVFFLHKLPLQSIDGSSNEHLPLLITSFLPHKKHLPSDIFPCFELHNVVIIFVLGQFEPSHYNNEEVKMVIELQFKVF